MRYRRGSHLGCGHLGCGCITALWALIWLGWALWWVSKAALIILALPVALMIAAGAASLRRAVTGMTDRARPGLRRMPARRRGGALTRDFEGLTALPAPATLRSAQATITTYQICEG